MDNTKSTINPLIINGDSTIETDAKHPGIVFRSYFNSSTHVPLWVKGNGNLTITASNSIGHSGILNLDGIDFYGIKAMEGYTVTLEDVGDNGNGTATWIYKVRSNQ